MGIIKDVEVMHAILNCLHTMMVMSINPEKTIEFFKACGKGKVLECFDTLKPS
jgi:hypothetical protein